MIFTGKVWKFGDNIDTDAIIPARYLNTSDPVQLAAHCMEDADPDFVKKMKSGDIILGGENFGCGSSREHAPIAIKAAGVAAVIATSFSRIFFRNAINIGLPLFICPDVDKIADGSEIEIDMAGGIIEDRSRHKFYQTTPLPDFLQEIVEAGGLVEYTRRQVSEVKV